MHALKKSTTCALSCFLLTVILITTNAGIVKAFQRQPVSEIVTADAKSDEKVKPLKEGDSNDDVVALQKNLRELDLYVAPTTGYYGSTTTKAVKDFQKKHQLSQNGVADSITQTAIETAIRNALCPKGVDECYEEVSYYEENIGTKPEITSDGMRLNVSPKLSLGQSEEVKFWIPYAALEKKLADYGELLGSSVPRIEVKLSSLSGDFEINPKETAKRFVVAKKVAFLQWKITPQKIGKKELSTEVYIMVKDPKSNKDEEPELLDLGLSSSQVEVEANLFQRLELFVQQLDLVKTIFGVGAVAVVSILGSLKIVQDAFAPLNPFKKRPATTPPVDTKDEKPDSL